MKFDDLFAHGLFVVGPVGPVYDFDKSTREHKVQALDKQSSQPLWSFDVMDADPEARERTLKVKVASVVQPVPPEAIGDLPLRPVVLEGVSITPYLKEGGAGTRPRIAYSIRATGMRAPAKSSVPTNPATSTKSAA